MEITSQNHNYAVVDGSIERADVTHVNLNDGVDRGPALSRRPGVRRAVPPRGGARPPRRPLPVRAVPRPDASGRVVPKRDDLQIDPADRQRAHRDRPGVRVRLLGHAGLPRARARRATGSILANSNPATIMTDPDFADRTYVEPLDVEVLTAIVERERPDAAAAHRRRPDRAQPGHGAGGQRRARPLRRRADRRERRGHPHRRGPRALQDGHDRDRPRGARVGLRLLARRGHEGRRRRRLPA